MLCILTIESEESFSLYTSEKLKLQRYLIPIFIERSQLKCKIAKHEPAFRNSSEEYNLNKKTADHCRRNELPFNFFAEMAVTGLYSGTAGLQKIRDLHVQNKFFRVK